MRHNFDVWIILSVILLQIFSLINLIGSFGQNIHLFLMYILIGWICFFICYKIKVQSLKNFSVFLYYFFIFLLVVTIIIGMETRGARRWLNFPIFNFQASEFLKPVFIFLIANSISKQKEKTLRSFLSIITVFGIPILLIFLQPDLASSILLLIVLLGLLYAAGFSRKYFLFLLSVAFATAPVGWLLLKDYQKLRLFAFINKNIDPLGLNYNINQSIIALGSGSLFGRGLGLGTQSTLHFLPEHYTDFAYASLVEQFGFLGGLIVLTLFIIILFRLMLKIKKCGIDTFSGYFLIGSCILLLSSIVINIGMNMGIFPVAGITLPFISYGGSSFVSMMILFGFILSI